jgi:hypothetical protein
VAHSVLDILQLSAEFVQGLNISDDNMAECLVHILHTFPHRKRMQVLKRDYENYFIF